MRVALFVVVLLLAMEGRASCQLSSARLGNQLVKVGDSERRVLAQDPDRRVRLESRKGGTTGIRYDFHLRGKTIQVYVRGGRVAMVCHLND